MTVQMRSLLAAAAVVGVAAQVVSAQVYTPAQAPTYYTSPPVAAVPSVPQLNEQQLEQLVGPVALYPDPLLGEVLTGATYPDDISAAASWVQTYPNQPDDVINSQPWEPSVQALAHYPSVLQMMGSHLDWTSSLGSAFLNQQQDVLNAVQQLRLRAQAAGNLATTAQQQVVVDSGTIDIVPVTTTVYVPVYDPAIVYTQACPIDFGAGFVIGPWLDIDFDWHHRGIFLGHDWTHRFDVHEDFAHERTWVRDFQRPLPVRVGHPGAIVVPRGADGHDGHPAPDVHRGFAPAPTPGAFGDIQRRDDIQHARDRGEAVQHPEAIAPPPHPAPPIVHAPDPIPVHPAPQQPVHAPPAVPQLHSDGHGAFDSAPERLRRPRATGAMLQWDVSDDIRHSARFDLQNRRQIMRTLSIAALILAAAIAGCQQTSKTIDNAPLTKDNVNPAATQALSGQLSFDTRDQAVTALIAAAKTDDDAALKGLFGPALSELVSPDKVQAANAMASFEKKASEKTHVEDSKADTAILYIGNEDWPFPIPLVKGKDGKWFYDTEAGKTEILARRIGDDELQTMDVCRAYVLAQREYGSKDRDGDGVLNYAQRIVSHEGKHDGLYWKAADTEEQSPLGPLMAQAETEGYDPASHTPHSGEPFHGYYFRILKQQGSAAPNGAYNYVINGKMIAGFALIASPAEYGKTGIMTFIISHQGKVYEKNLGPDTSADAAKINEYNPDSTWHLVADVAPIASEK